MVIDVDIKSSSAEPDEIEFIAGRHDYVSEDDPPLVSDGDWRRLDNG